MADAAQTATIQGEIVGPAAGGDEFDQGWQSQAQSGLTVDAVLTEGGDQTLPQTYFSPGQDTVSMLAQQQE